MPNLVNNNQNDLVLQPTYAKSSLNVIDFTIGGFELKSVIEQVLHEAYRMTHSTFDGEAQRELNMAILETYRETMRQIFDFMTGDFPLFIRNVESGLNTSRFINHYFRGVEANTFLLSTFVNAVKQASVMAYFAMRDIDMFLHYNTFILDNANYDHLIIQCYTENQFPNQSILNATGV